MNEKGMFITVEGVEGAGKSTQMAFIQKVLGAAGHRVTVTREPGGTPLGERLRALLLAPELEAMATDTELLLMFAARSEHLARVIRPALEAGLWVLCDRFTDATYAYQGGGRNVPARRIEVLEEWVQGSLRPDLTLVLDCPPEVGFKRIRDRSGIDRFEREDLAFFQRVRAAYAERIRLAPDRYRLIDASQDITSVQVQLRHALESLGA